jgi:hypothetical protein
MFLGLYIPLSLENWTIRENQPHYLWYVLSHEGFMYMWNHFIMY